MAFWSNLRFRYAVIGLVTVPIMGRLALSGTGHSGDFYRYLAPAVVGLTAGYLIGWARGRYLDEHRYLLEANRKLEITLRSIGDGVMATDTSGQVVLVNQVAEKLCGCDQTDLEGKPIDEVFRMESPPGGPPQSEDILSNRVSVSEGAPPRIPVVCPDGCRRTLEISRAPILDQEDAPAGEVFVFRDITALLKTEEELLKVRKLESVGLLAGGIAHDFNNILVAILGNLDLAARLTDSGTEAYILIREAEAASLRARDLTRQLLTFARGGEPVRKAASLGHLLRQSVDFVLRGAGTECSYSIPDDLWVVEVDQGQMAQVMQNLALNAVHAMSGGGRIEIECSNVEEISQETFPGLPPGPYVRIVFSDIGVGIPDSIIDRIFDPYFSTKAEGSGLGLAIVHSIIAKHEGRIQVESEPGRGTRFTIFLPASPHCSEVRDEPGPHETHEPMNVLLMDDDPAVLEIGRRMLEFLGHRVVTAVDGEEAIRFFREQNSRETPIEVLILDLTIRGGSGGLETLNRIMEIDRSIPAIVTSGYSGDAVMADFRNYGFAAALSKPFGIRDLERALGEAVPLSTA